MVKFPKFRNRFNYDIKSMYHKYGLEADLLFWQLSQKEILEIWNGIGASGRWYNYLIPKTVGWLNWELLSADHDVEYTFGRTLEDKIIADLRMKRNLIRWIRIWTNKRCLLKYRIHRARENYWFVKEFGGKAFWNEKDNK